MTLAWYEKGPPAENEVFGRRFLLEREGIAKKADKREEISEIKAPSATGETKIKQEL